MNNDFKKIDNKDYKVIVQYHLDISIKGVDLTTSNIKKFTLREWFYDLLPRMELVIVDPGIFTDKFPLEDNDEIKVEMALNKDQEPIVASFLIESWHIVNSAMGTNDATLIEIVAILKTDKMIYPLRNRSFGSKTTSDMIKTISEEVGLKSDIRIKTRDVMKWLQLNESNYSLLKNIVDKSYYQDDDLVLLYTQHDSVMVLTSLKTENKNSKKLYNAIFDINRTIESDPLLFGIDSSNENKEHEGKSDILYYMDYKIYNISPLINKSGSYGSSIVYNKDGEETIIEQKSDTHPYSKNSYKLKKDIGLITDKIIERNVTKNVHDKYFEAKLQNKRLKYEFFTSYILLDVKPNFEIKLLQKVNLIIPASMSDKNDQVHSGEYIIGGIIYDAQTGSSLCNQRLVLFRNGANNIHSSMETYETKLS